MKVSTVPTGMALALAAIVSVALPCCAQGYQETGVKTYSGKSTARIKGDSSTRSTVKQTVGQKDWLSVDDLYKLSDAQIEAKLRTATLDPSGKFYVNASNEKISVGAYASWMRHKQFKSGAMGAGGLVPGPARVQEPPSDPALTKSSTTYQAPTATDRRLKKEIFDAEINSGPGSPQAARLIMQTAYYYYKLNDFKRAAKLFEKLDKYKDRESLKGVIPFDRVEQYMRSCETEIARETPVPRPGNDLLPGSLKDLGGRYKQYK